MTTYRETLEDLAREGYTILEDANRESHDMGDVLASFTDPANRDAANPEVITEHVADGVVAIIAMAEDGYRAGIIAHAYRDAEAYHAHRGGRSFRGWEIAYTQPELDLFGDGPTESIDTRASARRYCELLTEALEDEFPGAKVAVALAENTTGGMDPWTVTAPEDMDPVEAFHAIQEVTEAARLASEKLWESDRWYAERLYGVAEFASALNWPSSKLGSYRSRGYAGLPAPIQELASGPVWTWSQVQEYVASRRSPEVVVISEVFSQDPDAKPYVVSYGVDGMPAHASQAFETLDAARASVPARFELQAPGPDADGDVILVGRTRLGAVGAIRTSDQSFAQATHRLLADLEAAGHQGETPATGAVIVDGHEVAGERFEVLAMGWARGEYDEIGDLVDEITEEEA
jgi:hypothetical protein